MSTLVQQRCRNHIHREAAARCPECQRFFCRECITEHDDRVICSSCLAQLTGGSEKHASRMGAVVQLIQIAVGLAIVWSCFYMMGRGLLFVPSEFHEQSLWSAGLSGLDDE